MTSYYYSGDFTIPKHLVEGLNFYCTYGLLPGRFLRAVINNDLAEACATGDTDGLRVLPAIVAWLYHQAPAECWGSEEKVNAWVKHMAEQRELARSDR